MADNRVQFRKDEITILAAAKALDKWPALSESDRYRRIIEQWFLAQDAGTSKTQKMVDIDAKLAEYGLMISQLSNSATTIAERVARLLELFDKLHLVVVAMKEQLEQHGFEFGDSA